MDLSVTLSDVGDSTVLALDGIADISSVTLLHDQLRRAVTLHPGRTIVVDLDGVLVLDDVALGLLLGAAAHARESGGDLGVVCSNERLRSRLAVTRFDHAVTVRSSIA